LLEIYGDFKVNFWSVEVDTLWLNFGL
jgi:hypothetical protein